MTDDITPTQHWPLPHPGNKLAEDVLRLRDAIGAADLAVAALQQSVAGKADADAVSAAIDTLQAAIAECQQTADQLAQGKVASVNGVAGVNITLRPEHLGLGPANGAQSASYGYDLAGNVSSVTRQVDGYPATTAITCADGRVTQTQTIHRGHMRTVNYQYDGAGRLSGESAVEMEVSQ
jgi:hypothetical protein